MTVLLFILAWVAVGFVAGLFFGAVMRSRPAPRPDFPPSRDKRGA